MMHLSKLQATGNDFLVTADPVTPGQAIALCDRHRGVGGDGLIALGAGSGGADCTMTLFNADGSLAEMSGNGIRCLAWFVHHRALGDGRRLVVDTGSGRRDVDLVVDPATDAVIAATVDMGPATFDPAAIPLEATSPFDLEAEFHGTTYRGDAAGMGNPHFVLLVDDPESARVAQHGPRLEHDVRFPHRANVEFVAPTSGEADALTVRTWERGVGETLSCGTGVCAAAAVAHRRGLVGTRVTVHERGGDLTVQLGDTIRLGGPVIHVFDVELEIP